MNSKRTGKFYRKNEAEVMRNLGLTPTKGSGSSWLEKEDGYNDTIICQLKSTDAESISVKQHDLHTLVYNSVVSHKTPVFAIQFLNTGEVWLMAKPEDLQMVAGSLGRKSAESSQKILVMPRGAGKSALRTVLESDDNFYCTAEPPKPSVHSSPEDRQKFFDQQKERHGKK